MEQIAGVTVDGPIRDLRRLLYCGEWIESHVLHAYMLHAPDFLGYESAVHMAADHKDVVELGLRLKKAGNAIVTVVGGREIHPINVKVGGFYRTPTKKELEALVPELEWSRDAAIETIKLVSGFTFPNIEQDFEFVSLRHPLEYPFNEGRIVSNKGLDIAVSEWNDYFIEEWLPHDARFTYAAVVPSQDPAAAAQEIRRQPKRPNSRNVSRASGSTSSSAAASAGTSVACSRAPATSRLSHARPSSTSSSA